MSDFNNTYDQGHEEGTRKARNMSTTALRNAHSGVAQTVKSNPENGYATGLLVAYGNEMDRRQTKTCRMCGTRVLAAQLKDPADPLCWGCLPG